MIAKALATQAALERCVLVLQEKLGDTLSRLAGPTSSNDGLALAVPDPDAYYIVGGYVSQAILQQSIVVLVQQSGPEIVQATESGDGTIHPAVLDLPVQVRLLFQVDGYSAQNRTGRKQTLEEYLAYAAQRYKGALIDTLTAYAPDGVSVNEAVFVSAGAGAGPQGEQGLKGEAIVSITIRQQATLRSDIRRKNPDQAVSNPS